MSDRLVDDYLRELKVAAWVRQLSAAQTAELESQARGSIDESLAAERSQDAESVHRVLDRLGPASEFVAQYGAAPPTAVRRTMHMALTPIARAELTLRERGWGLAEIGGLLLLILGPFLLWWVGPIFGIILIRAAANRWSDDRTHTAFVVVFALLGLQAIVALAVLCLVLAGVLPGDNFQHLLSILGRNSPGTLGSSPGTAGPAALSLVELLVVLPAPLAGVSSGIYLALSPRHRP